MTAPLTPPLPHNTDMVPHPCQHHAAKIQNDLRILTERLARINDNLARKISSRNEYDKTIQETEAAYAKVQRRPCPTNLLRMPLSTFAAFSDHGELANSVARAQAGERQPHEEEAGVLLGELLLGGAAPRSRCSLQWWVVSKKYFLCKASALPPSHNPVAACTQTLEGDVLAA